VAFLFSTIGLSFLLVGYAILGGVVFVGLESAHEEQTAGDVTQLRRDHVALLWELTARVNVLHPDTWAELADRILENYTLVVYTYAKTKGWDGGGTDDDERTQWTFAGALLYSITVITTIGESSQISIFC
jgi:hypothetical protein